MKDAYPEGTYFAELSDGEYLVERTADGWYFMDGTGWREKIPSAHEIRNLTPCTTKRKGWYEVNNT